jgi:hypothetical protein
MRATISFKLPEEQTELQMALDVGKYHSVLNEVGNHLRSKLKHGDPSPEVREALQEVYDLLNHGCVEERIDWV